MRHKLLPLLQLLHEGVHDFQARGVNPLYLPKYLSKNHSVLWWPFCV
jgi:hypothetical protein